MTIHRVVIDTNIVFEGLTQQGNLSGGIIAAWLDGLFEACISTSLSYEYIDVLSRKLSTTRWVMIQPILQVLLNKTTPVDIYFSWRPVSPDPGDDHVIDCALNANAMIVTANLRDFKTAEESLGLLVMSPLEFIMMLTQIERR